MSNPASAPQTDPCTTLAHRKIRVAAASTDEEGVRPNTKNHAFKDSVASRTHLSLSRLTTSHACRTPKGREFTASYSTAVKDR